MNLSDLFGKTGDDDFDKSLDQVMRDLESGKLYEEELEKMKQTGIDPTKPLEITIDGTTVSVDPLKAIEHLKPKGK